MTTKPHSSADLKKASHSVAGGDAFDSRPPQNLGDFWVQERPTHFKTTSSEACEVRSVIVIYLGSILYGVPIRRHGSSMPHDEHQC